MIVSFSPHVLHLGELRSSRYLYPCYCKIDRIVQPSPSCTLVYDSLQTMATPPAGFPALPLPNIIGDPARFAGEISANRPHGERSIKSADVQSADRIQRPGHPTTLITEAPEPHNFALVDDTGPRLNDPVVSTYRRDLWFKVVSMFLYIMYVLNMYSRSGSRRIGKA